MRFPLGNAGPGKAPSRMIELDADGNAIWTDQLIRAANEMHERIKNLEGRIIDLEGERDEAIEELDICRNGM